MPKEYNETLVHIVVHRIDDETTHYYGPFKDGQEASRWGFRNLQGGDWHWDSVQPIEQSVEGV